MILAHRRTTAQTRLKRPICLECLMSHHDAQSPTLLPVLSRGTHRSPHEGACFMEFASVLAGEPWSDRPGCTHPLLAELARHVNDNTSDAGRPRLVDLIPSVIGLTGDDLHIEGRIALASAIMALPVVAARRQRVMAVSVLSCDRVVAELDGRPVGALEAPSRAALARAPRAARWASRLVGGPEAKPIWGNGFRETAAPAIVGKAVVGVARSGVPDPDGMLRDLLLRAIDVCAAWGDRDPDRGDSGGQVLVEPVEDAGVAGARGQRLAVAVGALGGGEPDQMARTGEPVVEGL